MMAVAERCARCGGRLLVYPRDRYGSDVSCITCGATPLSDYEQSRAARLDEPDAGLLYVRQRRRQPTYNGMPL